MSARFDLVEAVEEHECGCRHYPARQDPNRRWERCGPHMPLAPRRYYVRACVVEAERLPSGSWKVTGHGWLAQGVEFSDEDFRRNFEAL
jgi:hypothetical protein